MITKIIISRQVFLIFKIILIHYLVMNTPQRITKNIMMNHLMMNHINTDNDEFNNYEYPTTSPEEPPPVKLHQDIETIIELTPDEALNGASILIELEDETVVEVDTPPFAGDGWRLRLENIARGGKDHYLQLKVQTESGLRIDGLRVLYKLELFPHDALLGCAVEVPTLDGNVTLQVPPKIIYRKNVTFER